MDNQRRFHHGTVSHRDRRHTSGWVFQTVFGLFSATAITTSWG
jgi:hypothetical protein